MLLARVCKGLVRDGALTLINADGTTYRVGSPTRGPCLVVRVGARRLRDELTASPVASLRRAYVAGALTIERGTVYDLLDLLARSSARARAKTPAAHAVHMGFDFVLHRPHVRGEKPLDLPYDEILDRDRQWSCALFGDPGMTLEEAQDRKNRHLAAKLLLRPGQQVLEIGSAWGGLALHLAGSHGVKVNGIAESPDQVSVARRRATEAHLAASASFRTGYDCGEAGPYDRIVSLIPLSPLGRPRDRAFFRRLFHLLADDGVAVVEAIGSTDGLLRPPWPLPTPRLSDVAAAAERASLAVTDVEVLRYHPAETLRSWRQRLTASRERLSHAHGPCAWRAWEFDLALAEAAFRHGGLVVFQLQLAKRLDATPLTREYMDEGPLGTRRSSGAHLAPGPRGE
jgi:cyclopropane-fatty-acyl-phospholipid synthase